nr:MAG TPA: hypothetical protein [Caudoviricetes sp.]
MIWVSTSQSSSRYIHSDTIYIIYIMNRCCAANIGRNVIFCSKQSYDRCEPSL